MLKKLWCWLVGWPCKWRQEQVHTHTRDAYGVYMGAAPPQVQEQVELQRCLKCGRVKTVRNVI